MMADDFDEVDLALTGAADDATRKHAHGKLWLKAPAKNSPELELMAAKYAESASVDVEFVEDNENANSGCTYETNNGAMLFDFHISLARSLGKGATWADYEAACRCEGVEPMPKYGSQS
jgi:hypothetical protein